ncbi:MAG TPA: terminase family protein, partial [Rhizomicrobium sp.]|nr:terminase family protein [Rhizomicrobium sp.]
MNRASSVSSRASRAKAILKELTDEEVAFLEADWFYRARPEQLAPPGDWRIWLFLGGRGAGKTRSGAEWIADGVANGTMRRIGLVGATFHDARAVMIEGESGLARVAGNAAVFEPSNRRVLWSNGAVASVLSADEPDSIRGHQFDTVWADAQVKLNKHASADTASLLYQTNYSGRAEMGLTGDDNFHVKVSPDGASWKSAL